MEKIISWAIKGYNGYYVSQKDDKEVREDVLGLFKRAFRFHDNFRKLPEKPSIIVCNYVWDRLENLASIIIPRDLAIVGAAKFINISKLNYIVKHFIIRNDNRNSYERMKSEVKNHLDSGHYVFAYVSKGTWWSDFKYVSKLRSGMFRMAEELNVQVTPLAVDYIDSVYGVIPYQNFYMQVGESFYVKNLEKDMYRTRKFFIQSVDYFKRMKYNLC